MSPRLVLVGPMGAGKTTVGALLAEAWGVAARDTDARRRGARGPHRLRHLRGVRRGTLPRPRAQGGGRGAGHPRRRAGARRGSGARPGHPRAPRRAAGGLPAGRALRRGEAGRARQLAAAAARQRPRPDQGAARRAHARLRVRRHPAWSTPTAGRPRRSRPRSSRRCRDHHPGRRPPRRTTSRSVAACSTGCPRCWAPAYGGSRWCTRPGCRSTCRATRCSTSRCPRVRRPRRPTWSPTAGSGWARPGSPAPTPW